jgi:carboxymethylenebutenolidase
MWLSKRFCQQILALGTFVLLAACSGDNAGSDVGADAPADSAPAAPQPTVADEIATERAALARQVDSETLPYADVNEHLVYGYFAFPTDMVEPLPAVILVHDLWGLNDEIRASADRLAAEGFMVLAIDLYSGETVDRFDQARQKSIQIVEHPDFVEENLRQAIEFVAVAGAPSVGTIGWGFGGSWSLNAALMFPQRIDAVVVYYGQLLSSEEKLAALSAPVLGLFGERDRAVTIETVRAFEDSMQKLEKPVQIKVYPDTGHAFADPTRAVNYKADIAQDAWQQMRTFMLDNLANTPTP